MKSLVPQARWNHIAVPSNPTDWASRRISPSTMLIIHYGGLVHNGYRQMSLFLPLWSKNLLSNQSSIVWHFIPPYSPHFGRIWEATVKQTKNQLLRACSVAILNFEELSMLLCRVEACLNSRLLVPVSSDPSDVRALTPVHILIGSPLLEIPGSNHEDDLRLTSR
ncbi:hypothetical protein AVEN_227061-1 [Araneus ventricosus]|uniref:Uncharacterized protein n=1 Tax=Araneus ventricosus TaxID=182803 RepID=A0A4Y2L8Y5_ARAVE|nr:hypothetical protein AVEN_227061-1 [Araneus ventricosus]